MRALVYRVWLGCGSFLVYDLKACYVSGQPYQAGLESMYLRGLRQAQLLVFS